MRSLPLIPPDARIAFYKARGRYLKANPFCKFCVEDRVAVVARATVLDHKVPHRGNIKLFLDPSNFQGLCATHHSGSKQREEVSGMSQACSVDGRPLDPRHPWNSGVVVGAGVGV